jgi:apolipoprotein N-acyltransferase
MILLAAALGVTEHTPQGNEIVVGPYLSPASSLVLGATAVVAFHLACEYEAAAALVVVYLGCLFLLARAKSSRWAFYLGLGIGFFIAASQLRFFFGIFGWACAGLWAIFGIWIAFFLLLSRIVVVRWPRYGVLWLPVLWLALEYTRSELYYLRFAWLTPGFTLSPALVSFAGAGVYGVSFFILSAMAAAQLTQQRKMAAVATCLAPAFLFFSVGASGGTSGESGPIVVGIQLEGPTEAEVLEALEAAIAEMPEAELFVLSEYCFNGPIPPAVRELCARHERHLVAGGKNSLEGDVKFIDTVFVVSPTGEIVFQQGKMVPIQFFNDGLPARAQNVWKSPWGSIGMAICYDLSYARVIDRLVADGAEALIIPAMDAEDWGEHEHRLHAKVAPIRAREYGVPIFRLASSGISQLVDRRGRLIASAPFPGQRERLSGRLTLGMRGKLPLDRYLAPPAVAVVTGLLIYLSVTTLSQRRQRSR